VRPLLQITTAMLAALFATQTVAQSAPPSTPASSTPGGSYGAPAMAYQPSALSQADAQALSAALSAAHSGDVSRAESYRAQLTNPTAQMIVKWAEIDRDASRMSFLELDGARRDLAGWPRANARQIAAERAMANATMDADRTIVWFDGAPPMTAEGAMALASALQAKGRAPEAQALIKTWWDNHIFDADVQARMLARFGTLLDQSDHAKRLDTLLLGPQGPAVNQLLTVMPAEYRSLADAVMAFRHGSSDANSRLAAVPASLANDGALSYERAHALRERKSEASGFGLLRSFPSAPADDEIAEKLWLERRNYYNAALRARDWNAAYAAMSNHGFTSGERLVEAEFFAGWIALTKLHDPAAADRHFETLQKASSTPITQGRAQFWRARAAEARGDTAGAQAFYEAGARYQTSFYGQLAAEKAGVKMLVLPKDPIPTDADRQRFEARGPVKAARLLSAAGDKDLFKVFLLNIAETLPNAEETALLIDLARYSGDQDLSMRVARVGAQRGFTLFERGYPIVDVPQSPGSAEPAFALSIARQESNFWPLAHSTANARGIMQLEPATARHDAAKLGIPWNEGALYQTEYNMRLGAYELGSLVNLYGGSYIMASGGYNAGPGRPTLWATECGDPRGGATDPLDYIECIPFTETRNYTMRTFETTMIYRARLAGGRAPLTALEDLKRGAYGYQAPPTAGSVPVVTGSAGGPVGTPPPPAGYTPSQAPVGYTPTPTPAPTTSSAPAYVYSLTTPHAPPPKAKPKARPAEREQVVDCTAVLNRHGRHRDRAAERMCPRDEGTHSASKRKTSAKTHGAKASRGEPREARHPRSSTSTRSANRSHKHRS
jgi:soluble lytic murein transglycosylase